MMASEVPDAPPQSASLLPWIIFALAASTLAGAYVFQYAVGLAPCPLCLTQRIPYWAGMAAMVLAIFGPVKCRWMALALGAFAFLVGAGLGTYHAGIEWHFWPGPDTCSGAADASTPVSVEELARALEHPAVVRCDEAPWRFLGLSLAGFNVLISLALAALSASGARTEWVGEKWAAH